MLTGRLSKAASHNGRARHYPSQAHEYHYQNVLIICKHTISSHCHNVDNVLTSRSFESGQGIKLKGVLQRFDGNTEIKSWVFDYQYLCKRKTKSEARRNAGVRHRFLIKKDELTQALAACDLDPSIVREGKERLFEERYYDQVFANAEP